MKQEIKTVKDYVDHYNKALSSVSGYTERKVSPLREAITNGSELFSTLDSVNLLGKYTEIPFLNPDLDSSSRDMETYLNPKITVGGLSVEKDLLSIISKISDETIEDGVPNMEEALNKTLSSSSILKMEDYLVRNLFSKVLPTQGIESSRQFSAIVSLLKQFESYIWALKEPFIAVMSIDSYLEFIETVTTGGKILLQSDKLKLIPVYGMSDDDLVVFHPHGFALGYDIIGIEEERHASQNSFDVVASVEIGAAYSPDYIKRLSLK